MWGCLLQNHQQSLGLPFKLTSLDFLILTNIYFLYIHPHERKLFKFYTTKKYVITICRFQEVIELLPQQAFGINCMIERHTLSRDTEYECFLVFKITEDCDGLHCPVKVLDLLQQENKEAEVIYLTSPSPWNIHDITRVPKQREDGWMEVNVWQFNSSDEVENDCITVNLKFISYEGTMSGLIVEGLEFRPM